MASGATRFSRIDGPTADALIALSVGALSMVTPDAPPGEAERSAREALSIVLPQPRLLNACRRVIGACMAAVADLPHHPSVSWTIPADHPEANRLRLHDRILDLVQQQTSAEATWGSVADEFPTAGYSEVTAAASDVLEITLRATLLAVASGRTERESDRHGGVEHGGDVRDCLDLVARKILAYPIDPPFATADG